MDYVWTKAGAARVIEEDGARLKVMLPGRKRATWISKTQVQDLPSKLRYTKKVAFDQKCGCTAVAEVTSTRVAHFNVYGSIRKFAESDTKRGNPKSAHHRRKELAENGFTRAMAKPPRNTSNPAKEAYALEKKGYKLLEAVA